MNEEKQNKSNNLTIALSLIIVGLIIAGAIYFRGDNKGNNPSQVPSQTTTVDISKVDIKDEPFIGDPNAPVTIAYWSDFQCTFCGRFEKETMPKIVDKYVKTGKVKIVFKDFQFLGPDSIDAGLVENAVWDLYRDQYEAWHDAMFEAQDEENGGFGNLDSILTLIRTKLPSIDADKIKTQVDSERASYEKEMDADKAEGSSFGINGTPGFIIGNQVISGAQPINVFTSLIDSELSKIK